MSAGLFEYRGTAAGLNEPLIRKVILSFYEKIRHDPLLGPIFEEAIGDKWDPHIERIILFWLTATGLQRGYDGRNFMPAHLRPRSGARLDRYCPTHGADAADRTDPRSQTREAVIRERPDRAPFILTTRIGLECSCSTRPAAL